MRDALAKSLCAAAALVLSTALASAAEIRVVTVGALQSALKPLGADYAKQNGDQVNYTFTNPANLTKVLSESKFDVIIAAAPSVEELDKAGGLEAGSRVKAVQVGIGVAVKEGAPKPDVSTPTPSRKPSWRRATSSTRTLRPPTAAASSPCAS